MSKKFAQSILLVAVFVFLKHTSFAQGNVTGVTPAVGNLGTTVSLQISGTNTVFTQATSLLKHHTDNYILESPFVNVVNTTTMNAEYVIPNDPYLVGWYDVYADAATPMQNGFYIQPTAVVVKGNVYLDIDANCFFDPTESRYYYTNFYMKVQPGNIVIPVTQDGRYAVELPLGTYNASFELLFNPLWNSLYNNQMLCDTMYTIPINAPTPQIVTGPDFGIAFSHVKGTVWIDNNSDCVVDASEQKVNYGYVKLSNANSTKWAAIQSDGSYDFTLPVANFSGTLSYVQPYAYYGYSWQSVICPTATTYPITISGSTATVLNNKNFGLTVIDTCPKIMSNMQMGITRPCFDNYTSVFVTNISPTTAHNVQTTITLEPNFNIITTSYPLNLTNITGNVLTFDFDSIEPFENKQIIIHDSVSCAAVVGQTATSSVNSTLNPSTCNDSIWGYDTQSRLFTLSYDPNNKETASHVTQEITANDVLDYVINFQNTGIDTAFNVTLIDTLPPQLIPSSLVTVGSSHNFTYHMVAPNVVKFLFHNINLPDSNVNEPGSKGFVKFKIHQIANNPMGTVIKNKAAIYFDFNPPIITNFTYNIISLITSNNELMNYEGLTVMPNPYTVATKFVFNHKIKNTTATIQIFDVTGKLVDQINNISGNSYDYDNALLPEQMYFYKVFDQEKQLGVGKLMKSK